MSSQIRLLQRGALGLILATAVTAGVSQNAVTAAIPSLGLFVTMVDDFLLLTAFVCACFCRRQVWAVAPALWAALLASFVLFAVVFSQLPSNLSTGLARQILFPVLAVLIGMRLTNRELAVVSRITALAGITQLPFILAERWGFRPFDPAALVLGRGWTLPIVDGLPGYYFYYFDGPGATIFGTVFVRSGGLALNPPVAGLMTAIAAIIVWRQRWRYHKVITSLCVLGTVLTMSRGGLLVLVCGLGLPLILKWLGSLGLAASLFGFAIVSQGLATANVGAASHVNGLSAGVSDAFSNPTGLNFGNSGNLLIDSGYDVAGESLAGILFSAVGLLGLAMFAVAFVAVVRVAVRLPECWEASLFLGLMITVLLSETGAALYGTLGAWTIVGSVFASQAKPNFDGKPSKPVWRLSRLELPPIHSTIRR